MEEVKVKPNGLAALSRKVEPKKSTTKEKNAVIVNGISSELTRRQELIDNIANLEAELKMIDGVLKPIGKNEFLKLYEEHKMKPESFKLVTDGAGQVLVIVMDKYLKVDDTKAEMLQNYPDVLGTRTVYTLNADVAERHGEAIAEAISNCDSIPDVDKARLLEVTEERFIKKGTIDRLNQFPNWKQLFELIEPIVQFKNCR